MTTNPQRAETTARVIEAMREIADGLPNMAERVTSLAGLEIDDETRASLENALEQYKTTLEACRATIEEIALEDRLTGQILRAGFDEIARKAAEIQLPPRPCDVPDPIEQARQVLDGAMADTLRGLEEILDGILPTFFDSMSREYRDKPEIENDTQIVGLKIHLPQQIEHDPRGVAVAVEVVHLAAIDNRGLDELLTSEEAAHALVKHFDGQAIALVQHGRGRKRADDDSTPFDDDATPFDAFVTTVIHPAGIDSRLETRPEGSTEWTLEERPDRLSIMNEEHRTKIREGEYGKMPANLAHFFACYIEGQAKKH